MSIGEAIIQAINQEIQKEVSKAVEDAKLRLQQRIPEIVSRVSLEAMRYVDINHIGDNLHIRISMKG